MNPRLELSRSQILAFRRRVSFLEERLPAGEKSLRQAAWAGLQDSMPRAALLSIHARVKKTGPTMWEHPSLVQIWGPRYSNYVVAAADLPIFSLGRLPEHPRRRARALDTACLLGSFLKGRRMLCDLCGHSMRVPPNSLRYAGATGTVLMRWDGARQPEIWTVPAPKMDPREARIELVRRYLHIFGPSTALSFARWAAIAGPEVRRTFAALAGETLPVRTPIGDAWILAKDEALFRAKPGTPAPARLLPSGDTYFLLWGTDRELLVPDARQRASLWTSRVWPGALLVRGELAGVWRRAGGEVSIQLWRRLSSADRAAVEAEAESLPLPGLNGPIVLRFDAL